MKKRIPILDRFKTVRGTYTRITSGKDQYERPVFNVWLQVNQQHFCVTPMAYATMEEAQYMADMLATALCQVIKEQTAHKKGTST